MKVKVYVEGGGEGSKLRVECRKGFSSFFQKAGLTGRMPAVIACGSRRDAFDSFCTALGQAGPNDFPILLVDSEDPVSQSPWLHLLSRDKWTRPASASEDQGQLMVQCMEAWFLADHQHLAMFFGQGFQPHSLPQNSNVEQIPKAQVFQGLKMSTRNSRKGEYGKGDHSFKILGGIDPAKVRAAAVHCQRLLVTLDQKCGP